MRRIFLLFLILMGLLYTHEISAKVITVKRGNTTQNLFFKGIILPIKVTNITSPTEGVVIDLQFNYGDFVKRGQPLIKLNSSKLETAYHSALTAFLKAKDDLSISKTKLQETQLLWDNGLITRDEFTSGKSAYASSRIGYQEALYNLDEAVKTGQKLQDDITQLDISDFAKVDKAFKVSYNYLSVPAPKSGIALLPYNDNESTKKAITVGSQLKMGGLIAVIADLSGLSLKISINELDINKIKLKQPVSVTVNAVPNLVLKGFVSAIGSQASNDSGASGGLPTFPVKVIVPNLTGTQRKQIRVGMSTQIKLMILKKNVIMIPLKAVFPYKGSSAVNLQIKGKKVVRKVTTGQTTQNNVEILSGLKTGDKVVFHD